MSDPSSPDRIDALARRALKRPPEERPTFLDDACADAETHKAVRARMEELDTDEEGVDPDTVQTQAAGGDETSAVPVGKTPERVGPWRLREELGRGSMGTVHLAERDDGDFQQKAALKLIRHDLGEDAQERFRTERQILAQLQHPNIAHLLGGGITDDGRPYFAMEYVDGVPLDTYCNEHSLGINERLRLFRQVCAAVAFSHRNLVVHRDLKPSNILVTEPGADTAAGSSTGTGPQVKLLDFGIAKALEGAEADAGLTRTGERPMTPLYAAPEQVQGDPVTTATDVYALGVVLHELLTGALPYDVQWKSVAKVAQVISNTDPSAPSDRVPTESDQSVEDTFGMTSAALRNALEGDLDVIVQKTLRKEPNRRYPSAAELGQDVERFLDNRPIEARPATTGYRLRRFVSRNRGAVLGAASALVALLIGLGVAVWQAQVAAGERDRARAAQAEAEEAITFLTDLFEQARPEEAKGDTLTVYELVDRGRNRLRELSNQPALQARMFDVVGEVYENLSEYDTADSLLRRSTQIQRSLSPPNRERLGEYLAERASVQWKKGRYRVADSLARTALQQFRAANAESTREYANAYMLRANIALSQQHLSKADSLFQISEARYRTLAETTTKQIDSSRDLIEPLASIRHNRASIHHYRGNYARAESLYRDVLKKYRRLEGPNHPNVLTIHSALGLTLRNQDSLQQATAHLDTAVTRGARVLGPRHAQMATYYNNLADVRKAQRRYEAADSLYRLTLAIDKAERGPQHPYVANDWKTIGQTNRAWGRPKRALQAFSQEAALRRPEGPSVDLARALHDQGTILTELGRFKEAKNRLLDARSAHARVEEPDSALAADIRSALATLYAKQGQSERAERWRRRADSLHSAP